MELLDILDETGKNIGEKQDKDIVHKKGLWHKEVGAWIVNEKGEILIQKRAQTKKQAPNKWSLTARTCSIRRRYTRCYNKRSRRRNRLTDKKEEIKLIITQKHCSYRGDNNAFRYEFFYRTNKKIEDFILQKEEVAKVKYITIKEMEELINKKDEEYLFTRWEYIKDVIKYLK